MMNRYITLVLMGIILFCFGAYFYIQKTLLPSGQPIKGLLQGIIQDINDNNWVSATQKARRITTEWKKRKHFIMLNYSEADYQTFENTIYQLAGATRNQKKEETISRATVGQKLWTNLFKFIPEP
jgi:hypothetical protein